jgi:uncharacterized SAM-binding protein YcdF (DUF218 family)
MAKVWALPNVEFRLTRRAPITDTAENAQAAFIWADEIRARELLVVSSWSHLRVFAYYYRDKLGVPHPGHP